MTASEARTVVGGLSNPSKMPGKAFGFSPKHCITGSKLRLIEDSVCSKCYACKGCYVFTNVVDAHEDRYRKLRRALRDKKYRDRWVEAMAQLIGADKMPYFRWHDSGDLQSVEHLEMIADVCRLTPGVKHYLPTREYKIVKDYQRDYVIPGNLIIRLSAHMINEVIPKVPEGVAASAVFDDPKTAPGFACPARTQGNECKDCRACWTLDVPLVVYHTH